MRKKLLLLVDNVEAKFYEMLFKRAGINCVGMDSGKAGLDWLDEGNKPKLVITDMALGGEIGDGITFTQQVRKRNKTVPVWLISGYVIDGEIQDIAREAGVSRFLQKSFDFEILIELVREELK